MFDQFFFTTDFDECQSQDTNNCSVNALCTNTEGSYVCRCQKGYEGDGVICRGKFGRFVGNVMPADSPTLNSVLYSVKQMTHATPLLISSTLFKNYLTSAKDDFLCLCVQIKNKKLFSSLLYIFLGDRSPHIQNSVLRFDDFKVRMR